MSSISGITSGDVLSAQSTDQSNRKAIMDKAEQGVASLLGMSVPDLDAAEKSGKTIAQLAQAKGVSVDDAVSALAKGLQQNAPANAPTNANFTQMATNIVNGTHHRHHGGHGGGGAGQGGPSGLLSSLMGSTGTNTATPSTSTDVSSSSMSSSSTPSDPNDNASMLQNLVSALGQKGLVYDTSL